MFGPSCKYRRPGRPVNSFFGVTCLRGRSPACADGSSMRELDLLIQADVVILALGWEWVWMITVVFYAAGNVIAWRRYR